MDDCTSVVTHSKVKVDENKRKAVFLNPERNRFEITKIDGCLVNDGDRCDYMVSESGSVSILIELKGRDVQHACDQLLATIMHPEVKEKTENVIGFLIVSSKYPRFDTFVQKAKTVCARRYKAGFHVVCDQREFDIRRVAAIDGPF